MTDYPVTPDGRYFVVRGRLWRRANPGLAEDERTALVKQLMTARRSARAAGDEAAESAAHHGADQAKRSLGERGPVWWVDGAPDLNRQMVRNTSYAVWFDELKRAGSAAEPEPVGRSKA